MSYGLLRLRDKERIGKEQEGTSRHVETIEKYERIKVKTLVRLGVGLNAC